MPAPEHFEEAVTTRRDRARIFANPVEPVFMVLLDEAALRRVVGGPDVMAEQLRHIAEDYEDEPH
ncbi:Scr1 family TA system antitoxin-like transcriptional regulator [Streptomyces sp. NPDC017979]|uniref:Scr1 family TA system antitoxin-like transcriptional regulator n=1 Tax=Streptomyces sp. NPDC017979 TaxID=3365024 RepID=UPI0037906023